MHPKAKFWSYQVLPIVRPLGICCICPPEQRVAWWCVGWGGYRRGAGDWVGDVGRGGGDEGGEGGERQLHQHRQQPGCRARGTLKLRNFVGLVLSKSLKFNRISQIDRCRNLVSPWLQRSDTDWSPFSKVVHQLWSSGAIGPPGLGPSSSCQL